MVDKYQQTGILIALITIMTGALQWGLCDGSAHSLPISAHTAQAASPPQWEPVINAGSPMDGIDKSVLNPPVSPTSFQQWETTEETATTGHAGMFDDPSHESVPPDRGILLTAAILESPEMVIRPLFDVDAAKFAWRASRPPSKANQSALNQGSGISIPPLPIDDVPQAKPGEQTEWELMSEKEQALPTTAFPHAAPSLLPPLRPEEFLQQIAPVESADQATTPATMEGTPIFPEDSKTAAGILTGIDAADPTPKWTALAEPTLAPGTLPPAPTGQDATQDVEEEAAKMPSLPNNPLLQARFDQLNRPMSGIHVGFPAETGTQPLNVAAQQSTQSPPLFIWSGEGWFEPHPNRYPVPFAYQPLYYEQVNLERCGEGYGFLQPLFSSAAFAKNTIMLPYSLVVSPPRSLVPTPGDCPSGYHIPLLH